MPPPPCFAWSPSPASRGRINKIASRRVRTPSPRVRGEGRDEGALPLGSERRQRALTRSLRSRPLPDAGEVKESRSTQTAVLVLAALSCARALPTTTTPKAPKGACHPCPRLRRQVYAVCATHPLRGCAPTTSPSPACGEGQGGGTPAFRRSRLRHSPPAITPMAQPQNRVSRRRTAQVFCPLGRLSSVKHAPCRPVVVPVDRGPRAARERTGISARGHRPSLPSLRLALPERRPP
jgi:hypothetical protein